MRNFLLAFILLLSTHVNAQYIFNEYDVNPAGSSYPKELTIMNGRLYFIATNVANGQEIFYTNGVYPNLTLVSDIMAGPLGSGAANLTVLNGSKLIFSADGGGGKGIELWQSDGTNTGTSLVKDIYAGGVSSTPESFYAFNGKVFFSAYGSAGGNQDLWVTDGTNAGTYLFKDINPTGGSYPKGYCEMGGKLFFEAFTDLEGDEIWVSDGTDTGTRLLKDVKTGMMGSYPQNFVAIGNKLFFTVSVPPPAGSVVYESDGTTAGTNVFSRPGFNHINSNFIMPWRNKIYLNSGFTSPDALWYTDGTIAGTDSVKKVDFAGWPVVYNDKLYFAGSTPGSGIELMVSDGTKAGTKLLADIISGPDGSAPSYLTLYKNKIYFIAQSSLGDTQLYVSDGTDTGTHKVINPLGTQTNPLSVTAFNGFKEMDGKLFFAANYSGNGAELWSLEDTSKPVGIAQVAKSLPVINIYPNPARDEFTLQIGNVTIKSGDIEMYDVTGRMLIQKQLVEGQTNATLQTGSIPAGIYIIKTTINEQAYNNKLVIQR